MKDDYLVDHVVESLEKMASSLASRNPNGAVLHFAKNMNKHKADMIHDALSHHASHYKAALKAGDKKTAADHMRQIFKTMHLVNKFTKNGVNQYSPIPLEISAVDPKPWERSKYLNDKGEPKNIDTKGWGNHGANQDYEWLQQAPHPDSKKPGDGIYKNEVSKHGHNKAYPLEEIKVNGKYIDVNEDVDHKGGFEAHALDSHPIYGVYKKKPSDYNSKDHADYFDSRDKFHNDESGGKAQFKAKMANMTKEELANRGTNKSKPVHNEVEGLDIEMKKPTVAAATTEKPKTSAPAAPTSSLSPEQEKMIRTGSPKEALKAIRQMGKK